jgi:hypothetical protein
MKLLGKITILFLAAFALAACTAKPVSTGTVRESPTEPASSALPAPTLTASAAVTNTFTPLHNLGGTLNPVVDKVVQAYALQNNIDFATLQVISYERVDWPDGCLGVVKPGIMCNQMITPGYRILLMVGGSDIELRSTLQGGYYVVAPPGSLGGYPVN